MLYLFWIATLLLIYCYIIYPMGIVLLSRLFARRRVQDDTLCPSVSIVIAVYNEEQVIEEKLRNCLALDYPSDRLEILVGSEATDRTNEIVAGFGSKQVRLVTFPGQPREGKSATLYRILPEASGEVLVFTDANAMWRPDALRKLVRHFADPRVGGVVGHLRYVRPGQTVNTGESAYWRLESLLKRAEGALGALVGGTGSIYAIRQRLYMPLSRYRNDDFELPIQVRIQGYAAVFEPEAISIEPPVENIGAEFRRKVRTCWHFPGGFLLLARALRHGRGLLALQLVSHKILRWLTPFTLLALLISSGCLATRPLYLAAFCGQLALIGLAAGGYLVTRRGQAAPLVFKLPLYFYMMNAALSIGWFWFISGRINHIRVWNPSREKPGVPLSVQHGELT